MRLLNIQILRAFAAMAVVLFHAAGSGSAYLGSQFSFLAPIVNHAGYGVDLFFVISGFIMYYINQTNPVPRATFIINRVKRIVPAYWAFTVLTLLLAASMPGINGAQPSALEVMRSFSFLSFLGDKMPVVFVGWSLEYEMFFYLSLFFAFGLSKRPWDLILIIFAIMVAAGVFLQPSSPALRFLMNPVILEFCFGIVVAEVVLFGRPTAAVISTVLVCAIVVYNAPSSRILIAGLPSAVLVFLSTLPTSKSTATPIRSAAVAIGDGSFAIYLIHVWVVSASAKLFQAYWPTVRLDIFICTALVGSVFAGFIWYHTVERAFAFLLRKRIKTRPVYIAVG
jgi:exopolysaccharide production protein ExoZ